jgi:hypothetical protein
LIAYGAGSPSCVGLVGLLSGAGVAAPANMLDPHFAPHRESLGEPGVDLARGELLPLILLAPQKGTGASGSPRRRYPAGVAGACKGSWIPELVIPLEVRLAA